MLCLSGFGKAFCFESHAERIGADGREILFVLFLDIPAESLRLLSFFLPSPTRACFSFFLSPFLLENFFFVKAYTNNTTSAKSCVRLMNQVVDVLFLSQLQNRLSSEAVRAALGGKLGRDGKLDCHFGGFNSISTCLW